MQPSAILFDFDGILVDTEWAIYQAWLETFRDHGHDLPLPLYTRCIGSDFNVWSPKAHLEDLTNMDFDWETMDGQRQVAIRAKLEQEKPIEGVVEFMAGIVERHIPRAVVSSSSHKWVDGWLDKLGLRVFFAEVICKGDAPRIKPAPDLYLTASKKLGVKPEECLVIEDSLNGLISAKAAGMSVWIVPNRVTQGLDFSEADKVFQDFGELAKWLFANT